MSEIIRLENISCGYEEGKNVLNRYNLSIEKGEVVTILGHNGSGKSTLSKLLVGLLKPTEGQIFIDNQLLTEESLFEIRRKIGIVFQNPDNQFVGCTVRDDIAFGLENNCIPHERMKELVEDAARKVNMSRFLDREPHRLSGGEKQRVAIAGVLALGAEIIILDEATSMLDPEGRENIMSLVRDLAQDPNRTIIMITHHLDEACESDRLIVMNQGEVILEGAPKKVFKEIDLLERVKLDVPFSVKVSHELMQRGILKQICTNDEELMNELCELNLKK